MGLKLGFIVGNDKGESVGTVIGEEDGINVGEMLKVDEHHKRPNIINFFGK